MNELDIMRNMSCCIKQECNLCDYRVHLSVGCKCKLMQDANCVMKMQHDAMKGFPAEIERLKEEIVRLTPMAKFAFDEDTLVRKVNDILCDCYDADADSGGEDEENSYMCLIRTLLEFGNMLSGKYKVLITDIKSAPKLVKE